MATDEYLYHRRLIIGLTTVILILAVASYVLRLYARRISGARIWLDDYVIGVGLLLSCIPCICNYVGLRYGFGKHATEVSAQDLETYLKYVFAQQMAWVWMMPTIKVAILFFYYRLFPNKTFRRVIYGMSTLVLLCLVSTFFSFLFQCLPIRSFWQHQVAHHCFVQNPFYLAAASLSLVSDVFILVMPMPMVWALNISRQRKMGLSLVFLLGGFVCVISFCRLFSLLQTNLYDITWTNIRPGLWSTAEGGIGVVSANLPSLRPLFSRTAGVKPRSGPSAHPPGENDMHNASGSLGMQGFCSRSKGFERVGDSHSCHSFADAVDEAAPMKVTWNKTHVETEIPLKCITVTTDIEQKIESQRDS